MNRSVLIVTIAFAFLAGLVAGIVVVRLAPARPVTPPAPIIQPPTGGPNAALLYWRYGTALSRGLVDDARAAYGDVQPPQANLDSLLIDEQHTIEGLMRAAAIKHCDFNLEYDVGFERFEMSHGDVVRDAARVLALDTRRLAGNSDLEGATDRIEAILRLSRHLKSDRILIGSLLVGAVAASAADEIERIGVDQFNRRQKARLLTAITLIDDDDPIGFKAALAGEKRIALASELLEGSTGIIFGATARNLSARFDAAIEAWDKEDAVKRLTEMDAKSDQGFLNLSGMFMPSLARAKQAETQILTRLRTLETKLQSAE
jgi:hypothetical protein